MQIFKVLAHEPDLEWEFIDGSIVRAHQHSTGACSTEDEVIVKSRGGNTTTYNVHMLVYYEIHQSYIEAARREKRFKNWPREWKINIIEGLNSEWRDLYADICS